MSATTTPTCSLGLTPDDLSAWRDHALAAAEKRRITAHVAACPACQRVIASHEALGSALHAEQEPAPDPRNFARLQARIAANQTGARAHDGAHAPRWRRAALWGSLSALAAAVIISALFFSIFAQQTAHRRIKTGPLATPAPVKTVAPTTPIAGAPLSWQTYAAPASTVPPPGNEFLLNGFSFAPSDARTAYICAAQNLGGSNPIAIWATHDGAQTWTQVASLGNADQIAQCNITVDALNPLRFNVLLSAENMRTLKGEGLSYLTTDGGKTLRALTTGLELDGLVTRGQTSVAIANYWTRYENSQAPHPIWRLVVSHDGFQTSTPIDAALFAQKLMVLNVWQRPGDGALLAETVSSTALVPISGFPNITYQLWQSVDMGDHWTKFATPANLHGFPGYTVSQPQDSDPWRVCGMTFFGDSVRVTGELVACTLDGGKTWTPRPLPNLPCDGGCANTQTVNPGAVLLRDGTLVTTFYTGSNSTPVVQVFALGATSNRWRYFGALPGNALLVIDNSGGGATLVAYSGGSYQNLFEGDLVGHLGGPVAHRGEFSFATLP